MSRLSARFAGPLRGHAEVPGDKSISHRALLLGALASGSSTIQGFLPGGDCTATLGCLRKLGIRVDAPSPTSLVVAGQGLGGLRAPAEALDCVRSGTTMRLLMGILSAQPFDSMLVGDAQLLRRPMERVAGPLRQMGAEIQTTDGHGPVAIRGSALHGCPHTLAIASAQVKSAILLAGLFAEGDTSLTQPAPSRDHTERMMAAMGVSIATDRTAVTLSRLSRARSPLAHHTGGYLVGRIPARRRNSGERVRRDGAWGRPQSHANRAAGRAPRDGSRRRDRRSPRPGQRTGGRCHGPWLGARRSDDWWRHRSRG